MKNFVTHKDRNSNYLWMTYYSLHVIFDRILIEVCQSRWNPQHYTVKHAENTDLSFTVSECNISIATRQSTKNKLTDAQRYFFIIGYLVKHNQIFQFSHTISADSRLSAQISKFSADSCDTQCGVANGDAKAKRCSWCPQSSNKWQKIDQIVSCSEPISSEQSHQTTVPVISQNDYKLYRFH